MDNAARLQSQPVELFRSLVVGAYPWLITISFGAVLLDIVYASSAPAAAAGFSAAADFLLLLGAFTIPAAVAAVALSWRSRIARTAFGASLGFILLGFFAPAILSLLFPGLVGSGVGTALRIAIGGLASILAFAGLHGFYRQA